MVGEINSMGRYTDRQQLTRFALEALRDPGQILPAMPEGFKIRQLNGKMSTWQREYLKFERFIETGIPQWKVYAKGNGKLPFYGQYCQALHAPVLVNVW
jgi:hypothetical protein